MCGQCGPCGSWDVTSPIVSACEAAPLRGLAQGFLSSFWPGIMSRDFASTRKKSAEYIDMILAASSGKQTSLQVSGGQGLFPASKLVILHAWCN